MALPYIYFVLSGGALSPLLSAEGGKDEIATVASSLNRMQVSAPEAVRMFEEESAVNTTGLTPARSEELHPVCFSFDLLATIP